MGYVLDNCTENEGSQSWNNIFSKTSNFSTFNNETTETQKSWKEDGSLKNTKNKIALNISAYENSIEAVAASNYCDESLKTDKCRKTKLIFTSSTIDIQNPFEFPRQQNDKMAKPELFQFKTSQHLLKPDETSRKDQQVNGVMTEVDEKQGQYAQAILQIISENTDDTTFALTVTNNSYGLLTRFVVCSEDDQIFQECYKHFSTQFSQIKKIFKDILNNDIIEFGDYLQTIEDGNLLGFQEIGKQLPPEHTSMIKAASLPSKSSSAAITSLPSITVQEIPLIHNLFYGYYLQCSNLLDLLISQLKSASIISYCKSRPEIWILVLDLFQAPSMPILELDENFFRIIQNWCLLIRYCITGSFHICQKLIPSMKEEIYGKIIDFSLEHINSLSVLLLTLNIVQSEEYTDKLTSVIDSVNSTINKCLNQGSIDVFLPITKLEFPQIKAEIAYREKIITTAQKILSTFDIEQTFNFLKRILSLITPVTSSLHSLKNCSNYIIWEIYCEVFSLLKCDSSNWSIYHSICLQNLPHSFCSCISPQLLWNNLYLPVYGENLDTLLKLVQQNFKGYQTKGFLPVQSSEFIKAEINLAVWLNNSTEEDCLKIIAIVETILYVFDSIQQQSVFNSLFDFYDKTDSSQIRDELFKVFKRKIKQESIFQQCIRKLVIPNFAEIFINPNFRISFFEFLSSAVKNLDYQTKTALIETSIINFTNLLKRALIDIWTFVSSSAEMYYHGLCDLLDWYSKIFDMGLFQDSTSKKLASDCVRIGSVCIDAIEIPSENLSMNSRISELISLSFRCLSDDKKSFEILKKKLDEIKIETKTPIIILATSCLRKSTECKKLLNNKYGNNSFSFSSSFQSAENEESDDESEKIIASLFLPQIRIKPCQKEIENDMALMALNLIKNLLLAFSDEKEIDEIEEIKLQQFFELLNPKLFNDENEIFEKVIEILFECCEIISKSAKQLKTMKTKLLETTASFVAIHPSPKSLTAFLPNCFNGSQALTDVAKAYQRLLNEKFVQPSECLQMPQRAFSSADRPDPAPIPSRLTPFCAACFILDPAHKIFLSEGMTISFWLSLAKFSDLKIKEHVVSIGTSQLNVKVFLHASSGTLSLTLNVFGATIKRIKTSKVFEKEKMWESVCLGLKVVDKAAKVLVLFGDHLTTFESPDLPSDVNFTTSPLEICIGSAIETDFIYEISSIFSFKGLLSTQCVIAFRSLGCEFQCLTECRTGEFYSSFANSMTKNLITDKNCNLLEVWSEPKKFISRLQRSILFVIRVTSAHCYGLSVFQKGIDSEKLSHVRENVFCLAMYKDYPIEWHCQIVYRKQETLDISLRAIGSIKLFVFLYALSVDKNYDAEAQLSALRLLFQALRRSPLYYGEFRASHGLHVLTQIMNTKTSKINDEIFDELCNFLFSELEKDDLGNLRVSFYTVIMEPEFLKTLLSTTELWKFEYFRYWSKLISLTATTLDTCKAKFCEFNSQILHRVDFLTPLLHALLDMFSNKNLFSAASLSTSLTEIYDTRDPLTIVSKSLVSSVCTIISELLSSPYRCPAVVQLWNFILLSHPAQDTYLDYTLKGHAEWVRPEDIESSASGDATLEPQNSLLSAFFEKVLMNFDKDKIAELWKETNSATTVRKEILKSENDYRIFATSTMRLDSLICNEQHPEQKDYWSSDDSAAQFESSITKNVDHWLITLRADLISSMCHILLACEDSLMAVIELDVITWKTIIVQLTNQTHLRIRNLIFLLLQNFFLRCTDKYRQEFIKQNGFLLLANHLRKLPVTYEIADSLFSIFCGECVKIRDGLDEEHLEKMETTCFRYASFHGLFALLEASVTDHALFWTVCSTLQKIFVANNLLRRAMIDCGIVDTMMNVLRLLCVEQPSVRTMIGPVFPLLDCWISFSRSIINLVIPCRDPYMYSRSEDFIWLCQIADYQLSNTIVSTTPSERLRKFSSLSAPPPEGCSNCAKQMVRRALSGILDCWFDSIQSVVVDSSKMIPVDERYDDEDDDSESDSSAFEIYYADSHFTSTSYYGDETKRERRRRFEFANAEELSKRLTFGLEMANNLFVFGQISESMSEKEEMLFQSYIEILLAPWKKRQTGEYHEEWYNVLLGCKERARVLLAQLIAYVLFPVQIRQKQLFFDPLSAPVIDEQGLLRRRLLIVKALTGELNNNKTYLESLLEVNLDYQYAMKIALHELALCPQYYEIWDEYGEDLDRMIKFLRTIQLESPLQNLTRDEVKSLTTDEVILLHTYKEKRTKFVDSLKKEALRLSEKDNSLIKAVCDNAMNLTCNIAELQNEPRKFYIQSRKDAINACAKANEVLANLVVELCHPEAPFFDESSWPKGYSLDTTENLRRERKRLKPDHYRFEKRFLKTNRQVEVGETATNPAPLQLLRESCPNFATTDYIEASNAVRLSLSATLIRTAFECSGEIIISERKIHFLGEEGRSSQKGQRCSPVTFAWGYNQLSEIYYRFFLLKDTALELFTTTGDAFLIVFATTADRDSFIGQLKKMGLGHLMAEEENQLKLINQQWRRGNITNFDYLMTLNKLAGRSFNDLMQYPVFPFILSDYRSTILDLNSTQSFRDLSKPMAIQNKQMEEYYIHNYESLAEENKRIRKEGETFYSSMFGAYHYGSHYSNTGIIAHYLVRVSPFTNVALEYQDNSFDIPDRLFNSVDTTWRLSASESTTDFKELIPEFFFLPEMFCNREKLELGTRQAGIIVDNVELPAWVPEQKSRLFYLIHRQALESQYVTNNLHNWIDLIFGFKQQGSSAVKAINVFHPATYRGKDLEHERYHDEISLSALRTMVRTYGQMPNQLFFSPHLPHLNVSRRHSGEGNSLLATIKGLRWGEFVGSPDLDKKQWLLPALNVNVGNHDSIGKLVPIHREAFCYGLPDKTELVLRLNVDNKDPLRRSFEASTTAVVSWKFSDNILRIKLIQMNDSVWINLIDLQMFEPTQVVFSPNADLLYIGTSCGLIRTYSVEYKNDTKIWHVKLTNEFFAHKASIATLKVCDDFHIMLSTSIDGMACLWDSNKLMYIRTLEPIPYFSDETITLTCISSISADIAIIYQSGKGSRLVLYTVNGDIIGIYETGPGLTISSLTMTNLEEGTGINCIAIGLQNGIIKLLDSWTLSFVCDISVGTNEPVISIEFTCEGKRLYAALASGKILCWQAISPSSPSLSSSSSLSFRPKSVPNFRMLNPFV